MTTTLTDYVSELEKTLAISYVEKFNRTYAGSISPGQPVNLHCSQFKAYLTYQ